MRRKVIIVCVLLLFVLVGCAKRDNEEKKDLGEKKIQIGVSFDNFVVERWQRDRDVFVSTAKDLGATVNVQNANGDVEKQIQNMQYFIDKKVDVIVVVPIEAKSLSEIIEKAKEMGIRVISYDRPALEAKTDLYISFDNEMVGSLMGQELRKKLKENDKVLMVCGSSEDDNVHWVEKGFRKEMDAAKIQILDTVYMDNWKAELAAEYISSHMDLVEQAQAIMCGNDDLAREVVRVLAENRMAGNILVVGQDADLEACQRIVANTQYMTVYKPVEKLAKSAAEAAVALANGEKLDIEESFDDGKGKIPYLKLEPLAVTKKNMDATIIDSGFHLREDVYIERPRNE